ncbi:recombinase family protein [Methylobacterium sp. NI91]|nr:MULTISPECIES: recombinase family protein [unclassified Methylobacterium]QIJ76506.1 recombinase family protein [Methylobacterium sp. CLZ]QIJ81409.1 recombinase family protein [Methylobacterium sp. NI91]
MMAGAYVSYLRVSTDRQGRSGLGLEAQRRAVTDYLDGGRWTLISELVEIESGARNDRPRLAEALALCRLHGATLLITKLDRLSRDAHFLLGLQKAGVRFVAADMPEANEMVVGIMAVVAQAERKMISARTRAALAAVKARGKTLGNPANLANQAAGRERSAAVRIEAADRRAADLAPIVASIRQAGATSLRQIAARLNERAIPRARGGTWSAAQVQHLIARIEQANR